MNSMRIHLLPLVVVFVLASISLCPITTANENSISRLESAQHLARYAASTKQFFQLKARSNGKCLAIETHAGVYVPCSDRHSTIYFLNGERANNYNIINIGKGQCLDRVSCYYGQSSIRHHPACDHCGAINWNIRSDGSVTQGTGRNRTCIYSASSGHAALRPCSQGFERFKLLPIGDHFRIKSSHGDCLSGDVFVDCSLAHAYFITGIPGNYSIRVYGQANICLDKEHCYSSTSNLRFSKCSHCGAVQWSIEGNKIGEDGMKNCIDRGEIREEGTEAIVKLCSGGYEELTLEFISPLSAKIQAPRGQQPPFRKPSYNEYRNSNTFRGIKIFRYSDGTLEIEFVHDLQYPFMQYGQNIQYMVTHVHTNIPYSSGYTINDVLNMLSQFGNQFHATQINYRYGGVPHNHIGATWNGLTSEFNTNSYGVPLDPQQVNYNQAVHELFNTINGNSQDVGGQFYYVPISSYPYPLYRYDQENNNQCRNNHRRGPGV